MLSPVANTRHQLCVSVRTAAAPALKPLVYVSSYTAGSVSEGTGAATSFKGAAQRRLTSAAMSSDASGGLAWNDLLDRVNNSTKWVVSSIVLAVLLTSPGIQVAWCVVGSILSTVLCKVLKKVINEARPISARKADPGMPSSHANSLSFLGTYAALALARSSLPNNKYLALGVLVGAYALALLRISQGYHTGAQVAAGLTLGAATAAAWWTLGLGHVLAAVQQTPVLANSLWVCTYAAVGLFGVKQVKADWEHCTLTSMDL